MRDDREKLRDILEAIERIERYAQTMRSPNQIPLQQITTKPFLGARYFVPKPRLIYEQSLTIALAKFN